MFRYVIAAVVAGLCLTPPAARADFIDLTSAGATSATGATAAIGGTNWSVQQGELQPAGTGVFNSFLTIQMNGAESGFNTGFSQPLDYDTKRSANPQNPGDGWTRAVQLSQLTAINGFYAFKLDINEPNGNLKQYLSLNQIQIFQSAASLGGTEGTDYSTAAGLGTAPVLSFNTGSPTEVFRLNNGVTGFTEIALDDTLSPGSGGSDMVLFVSTSLFSNDPNSYVTLYSQFGSPPGDNPSEGGYEEWSFNGNASPAPAPAGLVLALTGVPVLGLRAWIRRRRTIATA